MPIRRTAASARSLQSCSSRAATSRARARCLRPTSPVSDPELLWALAEMELRAGRIAEGTAVLQRILADDPSRRETLVILGCTVAEDQSRCGIRMRRCGGQGGDCRRRVGIGRGGVE